MALLAPFFRTVVVLTATKSTRPEVGNNVV